MTLLWVKVGGLWPVNTGGRIRSFQILSELSRYHQVTLLTTHGPGDDPQGLAVALPALGAAWPAWRAGGLPVVGLLRGADVRGGLGGRAQRHLSLGAGGLIRLGRCSGYREC